MMYVSNADHKKMFICNMDNIIRDIPEGWSIRNCRIALLVIRKVSIAMLEAILCSQFDHEMTPLTATNDRLIKDLLVIEYYTRHARRDNLSYYRSFIIRLRTRLDLYRDEILRTKISTEC